MAHVNRTTIKQSLRLLLDRLGSARRLLLQSVAGMLLATMLPGPVFANLLVYPTRLVFEGPQRAAQMDLNNTGNETATYRISLVNRRMSDTGEFTAVESAGPGELFADGLVRFSPRQVVLPPGATQTVRVSVRKPADLSEGEYRSHLHFERVPDATGSENVENAGTPGELGVRLRMLVGVSIPVIVRHGATSAAVNLSGLALNRPAAGGQPSLSFILGRTGSRSVYGDLGATFTPSGGTEQQIGKAAGVAVYTPNALRRGQLELHPPAGVPLSRGTLRLTYRERPEAGGKVLAEAVLPIP